MLRTSIKRDDPDAATVSLAIVHVASGQGGRPHPDA